MSALAMTARDVTDLIRAKLAAEGVEWQESHADGFKVGDPDVALTGIAVTFQPTLAVLQSAAEKGLNMVICHEATFWEGFDAPQIMPDDGVRQAKEQFVAENGMAIWRLHDHLHRISPEPVFTALLRTLGWTPTSGGSGLPTVEIAPTTLGDLAAHVQTALGTANVTVVGDPSILVRTVGAGAHVLSTMLPALRSCDVTLAGETSEFDTFEYVRDANALGMAKGLIRISHERLEEWGMEDFTEWLRPVVGGLPLEWISAGDPFHVV